MIKYVATFVVLCLLSGCSFLNMDLQIEMAQDANQSGKLVLFLVKDEKKYKELLDKSPVELNSYTIQQYLGDKPPYDVEVEGDVTGRMSFNTKEADLCAVVYTFTYRDINDAKRITGSIKQLSLRFYASDYPFRLLAYWDEESAHHKKEELPEEAKWVTIQCNRERGATFQWK